MLAVPSPADVPVLPSGLAQTFLPKGTLCSYRPRELPVTAVTSHHKVGGLCSPDFESIRKEESPLFQ